MISDCQEFDALAEIRIMKRIFPFFIFGLLVGCTSAGQFMRNDAVSKNYIYRGNTVKANYAMPREGWATDPHLSYNLYSYYPVNHYNNGIIGHYGYQGLFYH